jgi:hypothetical protein
VVHSAYSIPPEFIMHLCVNIFQYKTLERHGEGLECWIQVVGVFNLSLE